MRLLWLLDTTQSRSHSLYHPKQQKYAFCATAFVFTIGHEQLNIGSNNNPGHLLQYTHFTFTFISPFGNHCVEINKFELWNNELGLCLFSLQGSFYNKAGTEKRHYWRIREPVFSRATAIQMHTFRCTRNYLQWFFWDRRLLTWDIGLNMGQWDRARFCIELIYFN